MAGQTVLRDCLLIGEFILDNLPKETRRSPRIQIEYVTDANGMVTATATDTVSGRQQTVSVDYKKGVKPKARPAAAWGVLGMTLLRSVPT
jgi:molecular chaperone DnaK (HSP70)